MRLASFSLFSAVLILVAGAQVGYVPASRASEASAIADSSLIFAGGALQANIHWVVVPTEEVAGQIQIDFVDTVTHTPIEPKAALSVSLFMPEMGHGSSPVKIEREKQASGKAVVGRFQVKRMYFVMSGPWEVRVTLKDATGAAETQTLKVLVP